MKWSLSHPDVINQIGGDDFIEEQVKEMVGKLEDLIAWGRAHSLWPFNFDSHVAMLRWPPLYQSP